MQHHSMHATCENSAVLHVLSACPFVWMQITLHILFIIDVIQMHFRHHVLFRIRLSASWFGHNSSEGPVWCLWFFAECSCTTYNFHHETEFDTEEMSSDSQQFSAPIMAGNFSNPHPFVTVYKKIGHNAANKKIELFISTGSWRNGDHFDTIGMQFWSFVAKLQCFILQL